MNRYIDGMKFEEPHPFRKDSDRVRGMFETDAYVQDGVVRWKSNNNVPPKDILEFWQYLGKEFDFDKTIEAAARELDAFVKALNNRPVSNEERYEMEAAFGKGTTVVNVLTGRKIKL